MAVHFQSQLLVIWMVYLFASHIIVVASDFFFLANLLKSSMCHLIHAWWNLICRSKAFSHHWLLFQCLLQYLSLKINALKGLKHYDGGRMVLSGMAETFYNTVCSANPVSLFVLTFLAAILMHYDKWGKLCVLLFYIIHCETWNQKSMY